jgi:membrane protein required for colicin V production
MNPADIGVILTILICGLLALAMGFVRTVLAMLSWIGAALVTVWGLAFVQLPAQELIGSKLFGNIVAGVGVFVGALIVFSVISHLLASLVRRSPLNALDRTLGFAFGLALGVALVSVVWIGAAPYIPKEKDQQPEWLKGARTLPLIERSSRVVVALLPPGWSRPAQNAADEADRTARQLEAVRGALDAVTVPAGAKAPPKEGETGYKADDRQRLDNLIQTRERVPGQGAPPR